MDAEKEHLNPFLLALSPKSVQLPAFWQTPYCPRQAFPNNSAAHTEYCGEGRNFPEISPKIWIIRPAALNLTFDKSSMQRFRRKYHCNRSTRPDCYSLLWPLNMTPSYKALEIGTCQVKPICQGYWCRLWQLYDNSVSSTADANIERQTKWWKYDLPENQALISSLHNT